MRNSLRELVDEDGGRKNVKKISRTLSRSGVDSVWQTSCSSRG